MDRKEMSSMLSGLGPAADLCREDLAQGADLALLPGLVDKYELQDIYRRRALHLQEHDIASIGAFRAADDLDSTSCAQLALARVRGGASGYFFQLFLDPDLQSVVTCLAVADRSGNDSP
jgi:hypothetical protein